MPTRTTGRGAPADPCLPRQGACLAPPIHASRSRQILGARRLVDVVRRLHGDRPGPLTWWSWAGGSFTKDVGWRVDHQLATPGLAARARDVAVDKEPSPAERLSDHAPLVVTFGD